jgi:hypothetical protein
MPEEKKEETASSSPFHKSLWIHAFFLVAAIVACALYFLWSSRHSIVITVTFCLLPYIALLTFLSNFTRYTVIRKLLPVLWIPGALMLLTGKPIQIVASLIYTYVMIFGVIFIAVYYSQFLLHYQLQFSAGVYLILTLTSIAATTWSEWLIKNWHRGQNRSYQDIVKKYSLQLFGHSKVRYLIFVVYFSLIILFTFSSLNKMPLINQPGVDIAILQSFATYVAFDRLATNWRSFIQKK